MKFTSLLILSITLTLYALPHKFPNGNTNLGAGFYRNIIPLPEPMLKEPPYSKDAASEIPKFLKRHPGQLSSIELYELALLHIQIGHYKEGERLLYQALKSDPHFLQAYIQLGYLNIWEGNYSASYTTFLQALKEERCESRSLEGLRIIGKAWAQADKNTKRAILIFQKLYDCDPHNPDTPLFLGNLYRQQKNYKESEIMLKRCLSLSPYYKDATISLATLYLLQKKWGAAKELYEEYPDDPKANLGLARIQSRQGNHKHATQHYKKALDFNPKDQITRKEYARNLASSWSFRESEDQYALYLTEDPTDEGAWNESLLVKAHSKVGLLGDVTYTIAKENDPTLQVPVVNDYYLYTSFHSLIPVYDTLVFDIKGFFYNQKEVNIYNIGTNYNADLLGGQLTSHYLFLQNWKFDAYARIFGGWPQGNNAAMNFPFKRTIRFEPGASFIYDSPDHLAFGDLHVESFITKNFSTTQSVVIGLVSMEAHYLFRPNCMLYPQIEASVKQNRLFDGNVENIETIWTRLGCPFLDKTLTAEYKFQYSYFNKLTANYFSYKRQFWNSLAAKVHLDLSKNTTFDAIYEHSWQLSNQLIQPIGTFLFVANKQALTGNKGTFALTYRYLDHLLLKGEGHYFLSNLVYQDWNIKASLLWQF